MQNLSSPSDCIQFPVSDNKRMTISCIIHISDSRNSIANWSWGVETQTGIEYSLIPEYIMMHYLSYKITTSILQLCKFFHLAMRLRYRLVFLEASRLQPIPVHRLIIDIYFYHQQLNIHYYNNEYAIMWPYKIPSHVIVWAALIGQGKAGPVCHFPSIKTWINYFMGFHSIFLHQLDSYISLI